MSEYRTNIVSQTAKPKPKQEEKQCGVCGATILAGGGHFKPLPMKPTNQYIQEKLKEFDERIKYPEYRKDQSGIDKTLLFTYEGLYEDYPESMYELDAGKVRSWIEQTLKDYQDELVRAFKAKQHVMAHIKGAKRVETPWIEIDKAITLIKGKTTE